MNFNGLDERLRSALGIQSMRVFLTLACSLSCSLAFGGDETISSNLKISGKSYCQPAVESMESGGNDFEVSVDTSASEKLVATVSTSSKGNATLSLANLFLRVIDKHDDGYTFENDCLNVILKHSKKTSTLQSLEVAGTILQSSEKDDEIIAREKFSRVYTYLPKTHCFVPVGKPKSDSRVELIQATPKPCAQ